MGSNDVMLTRQELSGIQTVTLVRPPVREYFVTAALTAAASPRDVFDKAAAFVRAQGAQILSLEVFGIAGHDAAGWEELCNVFGPVRWPVTWLENSPEARLGGIQLWAVSGAEPAAVELDGVVVGNTLETEGRRWCRLGGLRPASRDGRRGEQARDIFDKMEDVLHTVGMEFRQVVRTWFYNDCILDWYDEFNRVRDTFFDERHVYDGLVPASTAVGGRNPARTALVGGLLAVDGGQSDLSVAAVPSPLQCPALEYGSSFSRAVEVGTGDRRRLFVREQRTERVKLVDRENASAFQDSHSLGVALVQIRNPASHTAPRID